MNLRLFTEHPATVDETYGEHLITALSFFARMFAASLACLIHAFLPFLFVKTGSATITELYERMIANRQGAAGRRRNAAAMKAAQ